MPLAALGPVLGQLTLVGTAQWADGSGAAHLWQLLIAVQVPIIAFFAIRSLPRQPKQTLLVLALQITAVLPACAPMVRV
jgi:hypothetical protein